MPLKKASDIHPPPSAEKLRAMQDQKENKSNTSADTAIKKKSTIINKPKKESFVAKIVRRVYPPLSALFVITTLLLFRFLPSDHALNYSSSFVTLPYPLLKKDGTVVYGKGTKDCSVIFFLVISIFCARYLITECICAPLAKLMGAQKKKKGSFLDMGWQFIWYTCSFIASAWFVYKQTNFEIDNMWKGQNGKSIETNPHLALSYNFKLFYLTEIAFWLSMIFTTVLEKWRKDFPEMMIHHFMTSGMLYYSYKTNFTAVGVWILFEQDFADIFLPLAKMSKYCKKDDMADIFLAIFAIAWIPTRHVFFLYIYYSIWTSVETHPVEIALFDSNQGDFFDAAMIQKWLITLGLFQCLLCVWLKALSFAVYKALTAVSQKEWTLSITSQSINEIAGVTVTQGSVTGTLKTALTGDSTSVVISTAADVVFVDTTDVVIGSTTVVLANIATANDSKKGHVEDQRSESDVSDSDVDKSLWELLTKDDKVKSL